MFSRKQGYGARCRTRISPVFDGGRIAGTPVSCGAEDVEWSTLLEAYQRNVPFTRFSGTYFELSITTLELNELYMQWKEDSEGSRRC